ncbi:MAG: hypothetical protein JJT94_09955 [Bernardetiaceae bacterium]|nr:hypothetical protein [Bernardetiaceae bacterium]
MSSKLALIVFILAASVVFPALGYYLDFRNFKKLRLPRKNKTEKTEDKSETVNE